MYDPITIFLIVLGLFFVGIFLLLFSAQRSSFSICCKAGLVVLNSFNFCLSVKLLISPSNLKETLAGWSILVCRFFPFVTLNILCHSLLACRVSVEKSADNLMGVSSYVICCFSFVAFNNLFVFNFYHFDYYVSWCVPLGFILPGTLCASWTWLTIYFPMLRKFSAVISQVFSQVLSRSLLLPEPLYCKWCV